MIREVILSKGKMIRIGHGEGHSFTMMQHVALV